jgi:hypothetical protein
MTTRRMIAGSNIEVPDRVRTFGGRASGRGAITVAPSGVSETLMPVDPGRPPASFLLTLALGSAIRDAAAGPN